MSTLADIAKGDTAYSDWLRQIAGQQLWGGINSDKRKGIEGAYGDQSGELDRFAAEVGEAPTMRGLFDRGIKAMDIGDPAAWKGLPALADSGGTDRVKTAGYDGDVW